MHFRPIAAILFAATILAHGFPGLADPPRCASSSDVLRVALGTQIDGTVARLATATAPDGAMAIALRVLPRRSRGVTRVHFGVLDANGAWTTPLHEITNFPARLDGPIALVSSHETHRVLVAGTRALRSIELSTDHDPVISTIASPTRFADRVAVFASVGDHFRLAWNTPHGIEMRDLAATGPLAGDTRTARVPERTNVVSLAAGPDDTTGLVMRTAARRYVIATFPREGAFHWSGNAPAGCSRHFCAGVQLRGTTDGFLATWVNRRDHDGLATPGAWALDARGHGRGGRHEFLPMAHGVAVSGPHGEPFAIQLARPIVLRGAAAPIAIASPAEGSHALPRVVDAFAADETLTVTAVWDDASITVSRVTCP